MVLIKCKMHPQLQWRHDSRHLWSHRYLYDQSLLSHWQASRSFFYSAFVCFVTCSYFHLLNSGSALSLFFSLGFRNVRMPWVPLSRCIFLIPMLSLTSTRTSLLVSQHIYAAFGPRNHGCTWPLLSPNLRQLAYFNINTDNLNFAGCKLCARECVLSLVPVWKSGIEQAQRIICFKAMEC